MTEKIMTLIEKRNALDKRWVDPCYRSLTVEFRANCRAAKNASALAECKEIKRLEMENDNFEMYKRI